MARRSSALPRPPALALVMLVVTLILAAVPAQSRADVAAVLARGDEAWARRGQGATLRTAHPEPIGAAVAAYREAVAAAPGHLEARVRLLRALYFQGEFATAAGAERAIFEGARSLGEETLDLLAARVGGREALDAMSAGERARALREVPEAPAVYFWSAVVWGLWGESVGRLKAARQGVGGRLRDYAETVIALDERYADAGGHRLLGRLHAVAPRIPFVTGWVDRQQALASLERAYSLAAEEPHNGLYLAEAILEHAPAQRGEAMEILRDLAARSPRPAKAVEDADVLARARQVLADQRAH